MSRNAISALILAHLAASQAIACKPEEPVRTPEASANASATPVATAPATEATATASATATSTKPPASAVPDAKTCRVQTDCPPGLTCAMRTDGHRMLPPPGDCVPPGPRPGGRPLVIDGVARVASVTKGTTWHSDAPITWATRVKTLTASEADTLLAQLLQDTLDEHASVASFARTLCQLVALGAPARLMSKTQQALGDEIEHARATLAFATAFGGSMAPGYLPEAVAPFPSFAGGAGLAEELLRDVFRGGCVGETLAAHDIAERASNTPHEELRALYIRIAEDEARHAALAYETALWLAAHFPSVVPVLKTEVARVRREASTTEKTLLEPLLALLVAAA